MLKVGLTGGLATGKSFVGRALEQLGCRLLRADEVAREVMSPGREAFDAVVAEFGQQILAPEGHIDRQKLAGIVFFDPQRLARLNHLVHPWVIQRENRWLEQVEREDPHAIAVVEAALMIEAGSHKRFDKLVVVVCRPEQQVERAMLRDGLSREQVEARIRSQMPLEEKRKLADYVIDNSGTREQTLEQVRELYQVLRRWA